jgi:ABC-type spermidine/putrescine transport system permease subunit I
MDASCAAARPKFIFEKETWRHVILMSPLVVFLLVFFVYPLAEVLIQSVFDPDFTLQHFAAMIQYSVYAQVLWNTLEISAAITLFCVIIGYPIAYYLSASESNWAMILLIAVVLPFWVSVLIRTYAWMIILGRFGLLNVVLMHLGITQEPIRMPVQSVRGLRGHGLCHAALRHFAHAERHAGDRSQSSAGGQQPRVYAVASF